MRVWQVVDVGPGKNICVEGVNGNHDIVVESCTIPFTSLKLPITHSVKVSCVLVSVETCLFYRIQFGIFFVFIVILRPLLLLQFLFSSRIPIPNNFNRFLSERF